MFSIFEFFRRRTRDSILAGAYDAAEILEQKPYEEPVEKPDDKLLGAEGLPPPPAAPVPPKKLDALPSPPPKSSGDLFSETPPLESIPPLPPRKRGRPPKNPPQTPNQP